MLSSILKYKRPAGVKYCAVGLSCTNLDLFFWSDKYENKLFKDFLKYSFLNILGMVGISFYILADTYFISKGVGVNGLSALNLAIPVFNFINGCGLMIGIGGGTLYSLCKKKKTNKKQIKFLLIHFI